jgi:hypothetical protein
MYRKKLVSNQQFIFFIYKEEYKIFQDFICNIMYQQVIFSYMYKQDYKILFRYEKVNCWYTMLYMKKWKIE